MVVEGLMAEGGPSKRYRIIYWGESVGDWATAKEALEHYHRHYRDIRPIINKNPKAKKDKPFYEFFDGGKEINLATLKKAALAEQNKPPSDRLDAIQHGTPQRSADHHRA